MERGNPPTKDPNQNKIPNEQGKTSKDPTNNPNSNNVSVGNNAAKPKQPPICIKPRSCSSFTDE